MRSYPLSICHCCGSACQRYLLKGEAPGRSMAPKTVSAVVNIEPIFSRKSNSQAAEAAARRPWHIKPALHRAPQHQILNNASPRYFPRSWSGSWWPGAVVAAVGDFVEVVGAFVGAMIVGVVEVAVAVGRGDRGAGGGSGGGNRGRSRGAGGPSGATPSYGPQLELTSHRETLQIPDVHIQAIGEKRKGYGTAAERRVRVITNHVEVKLDQGFIYHYDGMYNSPFLRRRVTYRFFWRIIVMQLLFYQRRIDQLPETIESFKLCKPRSKAAFHTAWYEDGSREYVVPMGPKEFKASQALRARKQDHDNAVFTAIMALNMVIRMRPIQVHPSTNALLCGQRNKGYWWGGRSVARLLSLSSSWKSRQSANTLSPLHGFPDRERMRLQQFLSGLKVTTPHNEHDPGRQRLVKKLSRQGARDVSFETADGQSMTVADYFQDRLNGPLRFPDVICVELSTRAVIPLELCEVPPGQLIRKQCPQNTIRNALTVLEYGQSEYVRQFGMTIADNELLASKPESSKRLIRERVHGICRHFWRPASAHVSVLYDRNWILVIYETRRRFRQEIAEQMVGNLVKGGEVLQLRAACNACQRQSGSAPTLIVVVLPEGGNDIYTAVKNFGDVTAGIPTQCMKAAKCFRAREQINVRLGGINVVPEPQDISFLTDPAHPAMVMGADITHAPPGSRGKPSFTALVGSIDSNARQEVLKEFKDARNTYPERILFFRDGVSETEFSTILEIELLYIRNACQTLGFAPTITFIVVGKKHKVVFFPTGTSPNDSDSSGNCLAGMVVDTDITSPVETDWYLLSHSGILGTSRPAHYNLLLDENEFTLSRPSPHSVRDADC
ncbi:hypothetical protein BGW80DRAFT_1446937 [Lactifluus volemus]|nr:hypothetical protein BGW80DRAFT_1446937 [Lactifluus volemus]